MVIKLQNGDKFKIESNEKREARRKFKEYSLLPIGLRLKRNLNIASNFLKSGPSITNFGNAVSALFGGYSPEDPDLHYGEAPGVGIKNFGNLVKTARVAREFNNVINKGLKLIPNKTKDFKSYEDYQRNGLTARLMLERDWLDRLLKDPNSMVHYDNGNHKSSFRKNDGAYIKNGKLYPGKSSKGLTPYIWWGLGGPWQNAHKMFINPYLPTPNRYISIPKDNRFIHVKSAVKEIGLNKVANETVLPDEYVTEGPVDLSNATILERSPFGWWERVKVLPKVKKSPEVNDSKQNVYIPDRLGWKELTYPSYINHVWNRLKAKGIKTEPFDRSNTNQETLTNFFNRGFTPVFKLYPQANLKAHAQEILRRMKNFGLDVDNTMGELPLYGKKSIKDLVTLNSGRTSYIGYYNQPGITGTFFHNNGTSIVDPGYPQYDISPLLSIATTMHHERNMHGTLKFLTPEMWKPYENLLKKMFPEITIDEFGRTVVRTHDNLTIPVDKGSLKKEELRATIGELVKNIYDTRAYDRAILVRAAEGGPDIKKSDIEIIRPHFEKVVDEMSDAELSRRLGSTNGYGEDYVEIGPKENPNFFEELRTLLKIAPSSLPFLIPRKEEKK